MPVNKERIVLWQDLKVCGEGNYLQTYHDIAMNKQLPTQPVNTGTDVDQGGSDVSSNASIQ